MTAPDVVRPMRMPKTIAGALASRQPIVGIFGPVATAKTTSVCRYVYEHCTKYARLFPGQTIRWAFVRDTYESIRGTTLKTWLDWHPSPYCGIWNEAKKEYRLRLPKGQHAEVLFMGLDDAKDVGKLLSRDLSGAVIEEPAGGIVEGGAIQAGVPEFIYLGLIGRLRHPIGLTRRRLIVLGNSPSTNHWCYRVFRPDLPQPREETLVVNVPKDEAPILEAQPDYYATLAEQWRNNPPYVRRYVHGEWLKALDGNLDRSLFRVIPRDDLPTTLAYGATCDAAAGGKSGRGDRSALVVAGFDATGTAYVVHLDAGRWPEADLIAKIFTLQEQYRLGAFGFEQVAFSTWLKFMIEQERRVRIAESGGAPLFNLVQFPRDTRVKKETRIQGSLGARLAADPPRLVLVEGCGALDVLWEEVDRFGQDETGTDDVLDALADLDQVARIAMPAVDIGSVATDRAPSPGTYRTRRDELPEIAPQSFWRGRGTARFWGRGAA
jgi:hypothetical protein